MFFVLLQVLLYFHQAVFLATLLFLLLWCLSKFLPRRSVDCIHQKFVLITGCDSGFGMETAIRLDQMGFRVFATCLTENAAEKLSSSCSERLVAFKMDVTKTGDIEHAYSKVKSYLTNFSGLWGLVNNAGITALSPIEWQKLDDFKRVADVNLWGMISVTKTFLPLLRKAKGRVVNFSSVGGTMTVLNMASYSISKYGVEGFSDALRREMRPWGIKVSIIAPGAFRTQIFNTKVILDNHRKVWNNLPSNLSQDYGEKFYHDNEAFLRIFSSDAKCNPKTHQVVDAVIDAVTSKTPKSRYHVGSFPLNCISWMPTWLGDKMLQVLIPEPAVDTIANNNYQD